MQNQLKRLIFHEKQQEALCAVHCINNLLQGNYITAVDLAQIAQVLDDQEEQFLLQNGTESEDWKQYQKRGKTNVSLSGDFSLQVVQEALKIYNLSVEWFFAQNDHTKNAQIDPLSENAYICNLNSHWFALRKFQNFWFNLDSTKSEPEYLSDMYLDLFLKQLQVEGYQIFVVHGHLPPCRADEISLGYEEDDLEKAIKMSLRQIQQIEELTDDELLALAIKESLRQHQDEHISKKSKKSVEYVTDYEKWINPKENNTKIQVKLPHGDKQVVNIDKNAPISAFYALVHSKLTQSDQERPFILFSHNQKLSNNDQTIQDLNLQGSSISVDFE